MYIDYTGLEKNEGRGLGKISEIIINGGIGITKDLDISSCFSEFFKCHISKILTIYSNLIQKHDPVNKTLLSGERKFRQNKKRGRVRGSKKIKLNNKQSNTRLLLVLQEIYNQ